MARNRTPMAVKGQKANSTKFRTDSNDDVGYGEFYNSKNSKMSEASSSTTGASSSQPHPSKKVGYASTDSEPARQARNKGVDQVSPSGPKDAPFFKHTQKDCK